MDGILNEYTETIHRQDQEFDALCGAVRHIDADQLRIVSVELARTQTEIIKCGRCFDDGEGY